MSFGGILKTLFLRHNVRKEYVGILGINHYSFLKIVIFEVE